MNYDYHEYLILYSVSKKEITRHHNYEKINNLVKLI